MPLFLLALVAAFSGTLYAADAVPELGPPDAKPFYDLQVITAKPGKLEQVHEWFRQHQQDVLAKHGATNLAYLVPVGENPENKLLCLHKFPSLPAMLEFSRALKADPLWAPLDTASKSPDVLAEKVQLMGFTTTDYSPEFTPEKALEPRVFELRTYTCPSHDHLALLHERFRSHTVKLFAKHGMQNLVYWQPQDLEDSDRKLVYLLAHESQAAAKKSFAAFGKDPDWIAAREASEKVAGGSLTEKKGVVSEFFTATEYSPLR
jgi:hypothetical protein